MGYIEELREVVGNRALILVRPSVAIINKLGQILLVQYRDGSWGIPGGLMELGESTEDCIRREVKEEINLGLGNLQLFGVFSGQELFTKLRNGHEYYNVVIAYICLEYECELQPDGIEVLDAQFYSLNDVPETTEPFIRTKLAELGPKLKQLLQGD
ncbi:ADP-ribose pyrophosphatase YjhB (NUDIX family) [Paenibacillus cellulosilyticus]|uniref:ADP-ribose pyrophosphatase YjhB (NUDIX family) n=1 Tax=Paenibacillus cellulosilyticus TaxID=375489 RepID=A0A2V2YLV9_9BACL|nr:NUDIX domain-containing protein [Paenibacillus cellulosilyticus]PWV94468.1 ADP-ribose pyrophosphatase YjhB (NUDIX family) [Paenibacillus cellulosilyticus]QKS44986.1 NUDIX domain-containing protein [Paenibacillus cellulosilyticus]